MKVIYFILFECMSWNSVNGIQKNQIVENYEIEVQICRNKKMFLYLVQERERERSEPIKVMIGSFAFLRKSWFLAYFLVKWQHRESCQSATSLALIKSYSFAILSIISNIFCCNCDVWTNIFCCNWDGSCKRDGLTISIPSRLFELIAAFNLKDMIDVFSMNELK